MLARQTLCAALVVNRLKGVSSHRQSLQEMHVDLTWEQLQIRLRAKSMAKELILRLGNATQSIEAEVNEVHTRKREYNDNVHEKNS